MATTHSCIAALITSQLEAAAFQEEESSMERGRRAQLEAWSLKRLLANAVARLRRQPVRDEAAELQAAVIRLAELSPHLLIDVGINPETGAIAGEDEALVLRRPQRVVDPIAAAVPAPAAPPRRAVRRQPQVRIHRDRAAAAATA